jgi:hypothetical protein
VISRNRYRLTARPPALGLANLLTRELEGRGVTTEGSWELLEGSVMALMVTAAELDPVQAAIAEATGRFDGHAQVAVTPFGC